MNRLPSLWISLIVGCLLVGCGGPSEDASSAGPTADAAAIRFQAVPNAFAGRIDRINSLPFDVVPGDLDADGDIDLVLNWHVLSAVELWDNDGGRFTQINRPGADNSGFYENPGIPSIYGNTERFRASVPQSGQPGIYLWHDIERQGSWNVLYVPPTDHSAPDFKLTFDTNQPFSQLQGLQTGEFEQTGPTTLVVGREALEKRGGLSFAMARVGTELRFDIEPNNALPVFIGPTRERMRNFPTTLWKGEPHGISIVDLTGTPQPEIFVARGTLQGNIKPPLRPKRNLFYVRTTSGNPLYQIFDSNVIAPDYGRGQRVEWVDIDADGVAELYIGNRETPNMLLSLDEASGRFVDLAPARGIALEDGDRFAWIDIDLDGDDDLVAYEVGGLKVAINDGNQFRVQPGTGFGLVLPPWGQRTPRGFADMSLHTVDANHDGILDLWVVGHGAQSRSYLFAGNGTRFEEISAASGFDDAPAIQRLMPADLDADGDLDAVAISQQKVIYVQNDGAGRMSFTPSQDLGAVGFVLAAALADVGGDGLPDLIAMTDRRYLLQNMTPAQGGTLRVMPNSGIRPPLGAIVRAHYSDGKTLAQRFGSAHNSADSQSVYPLSFALPNRSELTHLTVRWPGTTTWERFESNGGGGLLMLNAGSGAGTGTASGRGE